MKDSIAVAKKMVEFKKKNPKTQNNIKVGLQYFAWLEFPKAEAPNL